MKQNISVSVVIPSYNEATYIDRLLESLTRQKFERFEVIVSDAQSSDNTGHVVANFKGRLDLTIVQSPPRGPAAGRNDGAKAASGDWLLFLDADDDIDDPNFISAIVAAADKRGWKTATAKQKFLDATLIEKFGGSVNYYYTKLLAHTNHPVAPGWCILTKRELFHASGGFNEKIHFGEDYDYISRVGKHGFGFVESTYYFVDMRRPRAEGWRFVAKGIANEVYRHTHGYNLENNPNKYEFGKHKPRTEK